MTDVFSLNKTQPRCYSTPGMSGSYTIILSWPKHLEVQSSHIFAHKNSIETVEAGMPPTSNLV